MKKILVLAITGLMAATIATSATAAPKQQSVEGTIALPAPFTDNTGCFAGVHRRAHAFGGDAINGVIGYSFAVDKATQKKPFKLDVSGGQGSVVDMDITFYLGPLTTAQDFIDQGGDPAAPASVSFATRGAGGEKGLVPEGAENAIICIYGGDQGVGAGADFAYLAGKGVK